MKLIHLTLGLVCAAVSSCALFAQNTGIQRTVVHTADVSVPGRVSRSHPEAGQGVTRIRAMRSVTCSKARARS